LRVLTLNTAAPANDGHVWTIEKRYADIINTTPKPAEKEDNRSIREIVSDMWKKVKKGGE